MAGVGDLLAKEPLSHSGAQSVFPLNPWISTMSKHPGPQPAPGIKHYDCSGMNVTQKKAWRGVWGGGQENLEKPRAEEEGGESPTEGDPPFF